MTTGGEGAEERGRPKKQIIPPDLESPEAEAKDEEIKQLLQALNPEALVQDMIAQLGPNLQEMVRGQIEQMVPLLVEQSLGDQVGQQLERVATEQIPKVAGMEITKAMQSIMAALPNLINQGIETQFKQLVPQLLGGAGAAATAHPAHPANTGAQPAQQLGLGQQAQGASGGQANPLEQLVLAGVTKMISGPGQAQPQTGLPDLQHFMTFAGYLNQLATQSSQQQLAGMQLLGTALKYSLGLGVSPEKAVEAMDETIKGMAASIKTPPVPGAEQ